MSGFYIYSEDRPAQSLPLTARGLARCQPTFRFNNRIEVVCFHNYYTFTEDLYETIFSLI